MKRRQFIALIGGAAVAWPRAGQAQQAGKLPTIGFLGAASQSAWSSWTGAFVTRLRELGWIEGHTVAIEYRWAEGRKERFAEFAAEFVRLKVDVIVTAASAGYAAKQVTSIIPIVLAVATDPVGDGLVASLARPGGDVTGLSLQQKDVAGKRVGLLHEMLPNLHRVAILADAGYPADALEMGEVEATARPLGIEVTRLAIRRYRARLRGSQERRRRPLCLCRRAYSHQPTTHLHSCGSRAAPDDLRCEGER
jgi:putative tryptophan/tyrosine transport system substrate-binding protein